MNDIYNGLGQSMDHVVYDNEIVTWNGETGEVLMFPEELVI